MKVKDYAILVRAVLAEYLARNGIRYAFSFRVRRAEVALFFSNILLKGSLRGTLLYAALGKPSPAERFRLYDQRSSVLRALTEGLRGRRKTSSPISQKVYSLLRSWENHQPLPRQVQSLDSERRASSSLSPIQFKNSGGRTLHIVTDDHEWSVAPGKSEGKPFLSLREAEIQLVKKGRLINRIATECGVPWTHLIDIGSYSLIEKAAADFPHTWGRLLEDFREFLVETISSGNDLGIHAHPDKSPLAALRFEADKIWITNSAPTWGELPEGTSNSDNSETKLGMLMSCKRLIEQYGKLANPSYEASFFRAGRYSTGRDKAETVSSMNALWQAGIKVSSDSLELDGVTESLGRPAGETVYLAKFGAPWEMADQHENRDKIHIQALPLRTKAFPVYSVVGAARKYSRDKKFVSKLVDALSGGNGYLISIDHDVEIGNSALGGRWDCLDVDKGDWNHLRRYLDTLQKTDLFKFVRAQTFVEDLVRQLPPKERMIS